ncbi:MAG: potassium/proton antiporter [Candidatus Azobacteroides sp.]|nr:potassium/proton antiporter [Candidatus Azobacteroides sp.]
MYILSVNFSIESILLFVSILFLISLFATKAGYRFGVPVLFLFLGVGMLFGIDGLGFGFENYNASQIIGTIALCIILFSGGLDTKLEEIKPVIRQGAVLATVGVLLTAFITGIFIYFVVNKLTDNIEISFLESLLLASIMSSTDSASVFSILRSKGVSLKHRLRPLLELESGSNDPMAYMLTVVLIQLITSSSPGENPDYLHAVISFFLQLIIGGLAGYYLGKSSVRLINKIKLTNESLYSILLLTCGIFIFSAVYFINGNGYLAVYISGLVIGNSKFVHKRSSLHFFSGLAWFSQIVMFLTLGLLVNPHELLPVALGSILIGMFMILAGRPISVFLSFLPFRKMHFKDKLFISWVGLRGAVPIIFAILPLAGGVHNARLIFNIVFFITLMSLLIQGTTLTRVANWLKLSDNKRNKNNLMDFDIEFSDDIKSTMTEISLTEEALQKGNLLMNLPLPDQTLAVMIKRDDKYFIPKGKTLLKPGDKLFIITNDEEALLETYRNLGIKDYTLRRN